MEKHQRKIAFWNLAIAFALLVVALFIRELMIFASVSFASAAGIFVYYYFFGSSRILKRQSSPRGPELTNYKPTGKPGQKNEYGQDNVNRKEKV